MTKKYLFDKYFKDMTFPCAFFRKLTIEKIF